MNIAARAIVVENDNLLVMQRNKQGMIYYMLVGGKTKPDETPEQALIREVKEETGLTVTDHRLVYIEKHPDPYGSQYIYVCEVAPHETIGLVIGSGEEVLGRNGMDVHMPYWAPIRNFSKIHFKTPALQKRLAKDIKKGFPEEPEHI